MRVHVINHKTKKGIFLVNEERPCDKPYGKCPLSHMNVFTDDELANHELMLASAGLKEDVVS